MADVALFQRRDADLFRDAAYRFFQRQLHGVTQIGTTRRALTTTTAAEDVAKDIAKDVAEVGTATKAAATVSTAAAALLKGRMAVLIVRRAFLGIGQDLIGFVDLFEFAFGLFIALVAVRVKFHGQASVRLFDLRLFGRFRHARIS